MNRVCNDDIEINGIPLCRGDIISLPIYAIHHCEEFYPEPEKFDPERSVKKITNYKNKDSSTVSYQSYHTFCVQIYASTEDGTRSTDVCPVRTRASKLHWSIINLKILINRSQKSEA